MKVFIKSSDFSISDIYYLKSVESMNLRSGDELDLSKKLNM